MNHICQHLMVRRKLDDLDCHTVAVGLFEKRLKVELSNNKNGVSHSHHNVLAFVCAQLRRLGSQTCCIIPICESYSPYKPAFSRCRSSKPSPDCN